MKILILFLVLIILINSSTIDLKKYFNHIDLNNDNKLSKDEVLNYLEKIEKDTFINLEVHNYKESLREIETIMKGFKLVDGEITWKNFLKTLNVKEDYNKLVPQQIILSLTGNKNEMLVSWVTKEPTARSYILYGVNSLNNREFAVNYTYVTVNPTDSWIHKVTIKNLEPGKEYTYRVGTDGYLSDIIKFKNGNGEYPIRISLYGDMGTVFPNGFQVAKYVKKLHDQKNYDLVVHSGDLAYADLGTNGIIEIQRIWDIFGNQISPYAREVPYMTPVGNHEQHKNFTAFNARYNMPKNGKTNMFFSFDFGGIHFTSFNTESKYDSYAPGSEQYKWIEADLKKAHANRRNVPWIVLTGHKGMYQDRNSNTSVKRNLEPLMIKYKVDIGFWGHDHCYFRSHPVRDGKPSQSGNVYKNPKDPVHIVVGSAGAFTGISKGICDENDKPNYLATKLATYGVSTMIVHNSTHLQVQFHRWVNERLEDEFYIIKD